MRHTIALYIGAGAAQSAKSAGEQAQGAGRYLSIATALPTDEGLVAVEVEGRGEEVQTIEPTPQAWNTLLGKMHRRRVTIEDAGDDSRLLLVIVTTAAAADMAIVNALAKGASADLYEIDLIVLTASLADSALGLSGGEGEAPAVAQHLAALRKELPVVGHAMIMDNINSCGRSVTLDASSIGVLTGRLGVLSAICYTSLYSANLDLDGLSPILGMGMSTVMFDRQLFADYLLRRTLLSAMEREGVEQTSVDVNSAVNKANEFVGSCRREIDDFWEKYVDSRKLESADDHYIVEEAVDRLGEIFRGINKGFTDVMHDESLSLADKRAFIAALLNDDDPLLSGLQFDTHQGDISSLTERQLDFFAEIDREGAIFERNLKRAETGEDYPSLAPFLKVAMPIDNGTLTQRIRSLRHSIKGSARYMRSLQTDIDRQRKVLAEERRAANIVMPEHGELLEKVDDRLLEETFKAAEGLEMPESVDLREWFLAAEDQGKQGACSAFAVTAMMEYMLRRSKGEAVDLSPAYLYWQTRQLRGQAHGDTGATLYDAITAAAEKGVALEALCPYNPRKVASQPSETADSDAAERKVAKACNVERTPDAIKQALASGYPVGVSLKVSKKMGEDTAYISLPGPNEATGYHAMVVVGYSEKGRFFIVRNSWGTSFGDKGYCYIPYRYMADSSLLNAAYVITEIKGLGSLTQEQKAVKPLSVSIQSTDAQIIVAVNSELLEDEKIKLSELQNEYQKLMSLHTTMRSQLSNERVVAELVESCRSAIRSKVASLKREIDSEQSGRQSALNLLRHNWKYWAFTVVCYTLAAAIVLVTMVLMGSSKWYWPAIFTGIGVLAMVVQWGVYKHQRAKIRQEYDERIAELTDKTTEETRRHDRLAMRANIAAQMLLKANEFVARVKEDGTAMKKYCDGLGQWKKALQRTLDGLKTTLRAPILPVADLQVLDRYYANEADGLAEEVKLHEIFETYSARLKNQADQQGEEEVMRALEDELCTTVRAKLLERTADFSMLDYLLGDREYSYLPEPNPSGLMGSMVAMSYPMVAIRPALGRNNEPIRLLLATVGEGQRDRWQDLAYRCCRSMPISIDLGKQGDASVTMLSIQPLMVEEIVSPALIF